MYFAKYLPNLRLKVRLGRTYCDNSLHLPGPALKGGHNEEGEHRVENIIIVEGTSLPESLLQDWFVDVSVSECDVFSLTGLVVVHAEVGADEELPLEQLDSDDTEHEDEKDGDGHDVSDTLDGDDHTLNHLFESWSSVDGSQRAENSENTKNFEEANAGSSKDRDERDCDHHHVQNIESCATESSFVKEKTIGDELQRALDGEDGRKKVVELPQNLIDL